MITCIIGACDTPILNWRVNVFLPKDCIFYPFAVGVRFLEIILECPIEICLQRNLARQSPVDPKVIVDMLTKLEKPNPNSHPWEINHMIIRSGKCPQSPKK